MKITCVLWCLLAACDGSSGDDYDSLPPVVHDDTVTLAEDTPLPFADLLANDEHADAIESSNIVEAPQHGAIVSSYNAATYRTEPQYVPRIGYHGPDRFTYRARNAAYDVSENTATVTIEVTSDGIAYEQASKLDASPANGIAVGDIDGDGKVDAVTADYSSGTVNVLLNTTAAPPGYVVVPLRFEGGRDPYDLKVADIDGDGRSDIIVAAGYDGVVFLRNRGGTPLEFDAPFYRVGGNVTDIEVADFNRDGKPDIAALDHYAGDLVVQLNLSTPGAIAFGTSSRFATATDPYFLVVGDADGAGGPDLLVLSPGTSTFSLFLDAMAIGATTPAFAARIDRRTGTYPTGLVLADLDGDQRPEVAVLDEWELWIYANRSTGSVPDYVAARVLDLDVEATRLAAFDIDGAGGIDLVIGSRYAPYTYLLNTSGAAGFNFDTQDAKIGDAATREKASLGEPGGMVTADFGGTGTQELLVTGASGTFVLFE